MICHQFFRLFPAQNRKNGQLRIPLTQNSLGTKFHFKQYQTIIFLSETEFNINIEFGTLELV